MGGLVLSGLAVFATLPLVATAGIDAAFGGSGGGAAAAGPALAGVPPGMLGRYGAAAAECPGLPWQVLAAVGTVESDNGSSDAPGVHSGRNPAGAEGPMQFEPATFARYDLPVPSGGADPPSPYDPTDAVWAAARMLCADGGADPGHLSAALFDYNHSIAYVTRVLDVAATYGWDPSGRAGTTAAAGTAVQYALAQVGTPYVWGGEQAGVGFDCSGLAQAAMAAAGIAVPRVAQDQFDVGPRLPAGAPLAPGDLVFFGSGPADVTHVGLVVDPAGLMVDAPHAGADVRTETFPTTVGAVWGTDRYLGATDPAVGARPAGGAGPPPA